MNENEFKKTVLREAGPSDRQYEITITVIAKYTDLGDESWDQGLECFRQYGSAEIAGVEVLGPRDKRRLC